MVLITVISIGFTQEPELGKWRWSEDTLQPTDDKQVHAVGSFGLYYLFTSKGMTRGDAINTNMFTIMVRGETDTIIKWNCYIRMTQIKAGVNL